MGATLRPSADEGEQDVVPAFHPMAFRAARWWARPDSNRRPSRCKRGALPTALRAQHRQGTRSGVGPGDMGLGDNPATRTANRITGEHGGDG